MYLPQRIAALSSVLFVLGSAAAFADIPPTTHYAGTINGNIPIIMELHDSYVDPVDGTYRYAQFARELSLSGKHADIGYALAESGDDGNTTGTFKLAPSKNAEGKLAGTWKSADGKKSLPVSLTAVAETITLESARSDRFEVTTRYLKFLDHGIGPAAPFRAALNDRLAKEGLDTHNDAVKGLITDTDQAAKDGFQGAMPWTQDHTPTLLFAGEHLVSIRNANYSFTGGAHGNHGDDAENYTWQNGKLVALANTDLITPAAMEKLRAMCVQDLKAQKAGWPDEVKWDKDARPTINFTASALVITFDPYEAGSYAEGFYTVALPWEKVKPFLPTNSPLHELAGH